MATEKSLQMVTLDALVSAKEIVVTCGPGGVGKTTTAAATALMAATHHPGRVLCLTVDPAKRLADALGLKGLGNTEQVVPKEALESAGIKLRGELSVAMLDTKQSWDDLVCRHAPDEETKAKILENPLYRNISSRFIQSHDYIAMERLYEIHSEGKFDLVVVDTPPSRHAIDFLDAPQRMGDFFSSRLLRWLIVPYRNRFVNLASKPFYQVADRILGTQFLEDIAEFFILFQSMYDGFVERAHAVSRLLQDRRTTFLVISTLEAAPLREAEYFLNALGDRTLHLGALIVNKVLPPYFSELEKRSLAQRLSKESAELGALVETATKTESPGQAERVLREVGESFLNFSIVAGREAEQLAELSKYPESIISVPFFEQDISDLGHLMDLGRQIWS